MFHLCLMESIRWTQGNNIGLKVVVLMMLTMVIINMVMLEMTWITVVLKETYLCWMNSRE